ncbi:MAG: AMP-dependent synthetase and ligase [Gemmatimonadetes bacterium]|jgi:long-chain acyl-CoA synthetase|nr:AMP-dependent synthetase and ligase [Gemmatimonadota bacterium]
MLSSGGPRNSTPGTLTRLFFDAVDRREKPNAMQVKVNGVYQPIASRVIADRVRRIALGLAELGVQAGDRVAIFSENRPEWAMADYACLTARLSDVPLYPNLPPEQAAYIIRDCGAVAIFVSDATQAEKIAGVRAKCPTLRHVITFAADRHAGADLTLAELEARGAAVDSEARTAEYRTSALAAQPDDVATLIYTSGTTGEPKGVMLTHDNLVSNVLASAAQIPFDTGNDTCLSFLPLSHIFERMAGHYLMFHVGASIAYAESIDTVPLDMQTVRPSLVLSVPRLYEKMYARVLENALAGGAVKKRIFFWARSVAERWADVRLAGGTPRGLLALQYAIAQKLVFSKLKARTGGRLRYFVSGGAPLSPEINKFFYAAGLEILEGYGLTETSPVIAVNTPAAFRIGTVGKPLPGVEVTVAPDGEILTRGPHVMKGYYNKPAATAEAIDAEGWFHTGDIGELRDGYLAITDRKKDIIVTAGGKNIAPQPIEGLIKTNKYVSQAVVIGDKRKFPVVLVVPNWDNLEKYARNKNLMWTERSQLLRMPVINAKIEKEVLGQLHGLAGFETPKKVALLEHDFTVERGELTPTLKVKRRVIDQTYRSVIDALYAEEPALAAV